MSLTNAVGAIWLFAHIFFPIGFRNRLAVMGNWAWPYATWRRNARIIVGRAGAASRPWNTQ